MSHDCTRDGHVCGEAETLHSVGAYRYRCVRCGAAALAVVVDFSGWSGSDAQQEINRETAQRARERFTRKHGRITA